jgi:2-hydroxycyclohexanecarboxyl-CoA dehydrogenase
MNLRLGGEATVVAGGALGIGRAIALEFAREGAPVAIVDILPATGDVAQQVAAESGASVVGYVADMSDDSAILAAAKAIEAELGPVRHAVYAVGAGSGKYGFPFWKLAPADWPRVLDVNLVGAVRMAHAFAPLLAERRRGTLLFLSSVAGQIGSPTDPPYSASKAAILNFMQVAARDLAPYGVRANAICPGMVKTSLAEAVFGAWLERQGAGEQRTFDEWASEKIGRVTPLARWQEAEDIAAMAVFLASENAKNITGQTFNIDGGQVMK